MEVTDWILSISAASIGIILSVAAYFAQKWIQSVDETLKEHSSDFKNLAKQVGSLEQKQAAQTEDISKTIRTQVATIRLPVGKIDEIKEELGVVKTVVQDKVLPQLSRQSENFGRVTVLEKTIEDQNTKIITMYNAIKLVIDRQKSQK